MTNVIQSSPNTVDVTTPTATTSVEAITASATISTGSTTAAAGPIVGDAGMIAVFDDPSGLVDAGITAAAQTLGNVLSIEFEAAGCRVEGGAEIAGFGPIYLIAGEFINFGAQGQDVGSLDMQPHTSFSAPRRLTILLRDAGTELAVTGDGEVRGENTGDQMHSMAMQVNGRVTMTNLASGAAFFSGSATHLWLVDLEKYDQVKLTALVLVTGSSGSEIRLGYATSTSNPPVIGDFSADVGASEVSLDIGSTGWKTSGWIDLAAGAKGIGRYLALEQSGGNGTADPSVTGLLIEFRNTL